MKKTFFYTKAELYELFLRLSPLKLYQQQTGYGDYGEEVRLSYQHFCYHLLDTFIKLHFGVEHFSHPFPLNSIANPCLMISFN